MRSFRDKTGFPGKIKINGYLARMWGGGREIFDSVCTKRGRGECHED